MSAEKHFKTAQRAYKRLQGEDRAGASLAAQVLRNLRQAGKTLDDLDPRIDSEKLDSALLKAAGQGDLTELKKLWSTAAAHAPPVAPRRMLRSQADAIDAALREMTRQYLAKPPSPSG